MEIKEITVRELKEKMDKKDDFQLIDVREFHEFNFVNIGGELIPLGRISDNIKAIEKEKPVVIMCRSGVRSANAIQLLQTQHGFNNLLNLQGGILAWVDEIDSTKPKY